VACARLGRGYDLWLRGHTTYEILRDLGGLIGSVIALLAAGVAYYAGRMQVKATARATSDQIAAQRTKEEKEVANVREAVQIEVTTLVKGIVDLANTIGDQRKRGGSVLPNYTAWILGTPTVYPAIANRVGLLADPYPVVIFYSMLAQAQAILRSPPSQDPIGQTLAYLEPALALARPIVAGEAFGGQRQDTEWRQRTTEAIDRSLREDFWFPSSK
jgi:hypothetical protein